MSLIRDLLRPYRAWLIVILPALLVETAMRPAPPWPLKVALDSAVGRRPLPAWIVLALGQRIARDSVAIAAAAAAGFAIIGLLGSIVKYVEHYHTESVGQRLAD